MKIKRFLADDLSSALAAVRRELGREAVILATRRVARPGWRRAFRRFDRIEVSAAIEEAAFAAHISTNLRGVRAAPEGGRQVGGIGDAAARAPGRSAMAPASAGARGDAHPGACAAASNVRSGAEADSPAPAVDGEAFAGLRFSTVQAPVAADTCAWGCDTPHVPSGTARAEVDIRERGAPDVLRRALFADDLAPDNLPAPQAIRIQAGARRLVAFIGPTGAGKTTTMAKIAAHLHLQQGWRVGLVTADTFRVGAVEQLAAYARLLGLPLEVTPTPGALERALERMRSADVILIDTSGRGHHDVRRMGDLFAFLNVARDAGTVGGRAGMIHPGAGDARPQTGMGHVPAGLEVHLVLAAPTRREEVAAIVRAYRPHIDRCLLTKLDECEAPPEALAVISAAGLTLSYCCAGQRVPEDLALAWPDQLAAGIARGASAAPLLGVHGTAQAAGT